MATRQEQEPFSAQSITHDNTVVNFQAVLPHITKVNKLFMRTRDSTHFLLMGSRRHSLTRSFAKCFTLLLLSDKYKWRPGLRNKQPLIHRLAQLITYSSNGILCPGSYTCITFLTHILDMNNPVHLKHFQVMTSTATKCWDRSVKCVD